MLSSLLHILGRTVRLLVAVLVVGFLVFIALTRTQVGRDEVRREIERQFERSYAGRLEIGRLQGNLARTLFARDVRLFGPGGELILTVDSAVVRPGWRDLLRRTFSTGQIELFGPHLSLERTAGGQWNVAEALRRRQVVVGGEPWSFRSADLRVVDGRIRSRYEGSPPRVTAEGLLFDFAASELSGLNLHASIEVRPGLTLVELFEATGTLPTLGTTIGDLRGQLAYEDGALALSGIHLRAGELALSGSGSIDPLHGAPLEETAVALDLDASVLSAGVLRTLVPAYPLQATIVASGRLQGLLSDLRGSVEVARGETRLAAAGTVSGLPDSARFDLSLTESRLDPRDVAAVLPGLDLSAWRHLGPISGTVSARGLASVGGPGRLERVESKVDVRSAAGRVRGTIDGRRGAADTWIYRADVRGAELNVGRLLRRPDWGSQLAGRLRLSGQGHRLERAQSAVVLDLAASHIAGRTVDSLHLELGTNRGLVHATGWAAEAATGRIGIEGSADLAGEVPRWRAEARLFDLDAGRLLLVDSLATRLRAVLALEARGRSLAELDGEAVLEVDSSAVRRNGSWRSIPPHVSTLRIAQIGHPQPLLEIGGDVLSLTMQGDVALTPLLHLGELWGSAVAATLREELDKPYAASDSLRRRRDVLPAEEPVADESAREVAREKARRWLAAHGLERQQLHVQAAIGRSDILAALLPGISRLVTDAHLSLDANIGPDALRLVLDVRADTMHLERFESGPLSAGLTLRGRLDAPLRESLVIDAVVAAPELRIRGQRLRDTRGELRLARRGGTLLVTTGGTNVAGPLRLQARVDPLPDRNRVTITELLLATSEYTWSTESESTIDLYDRAVVIPNLVLENRSLSSTAVQRVSLRGALSPALEDTLYVGLGNLLLRQLSDLASLNYVVGGSLNGRVALTGLFAQPEVTGELDVATLSFDDRLLGRLHVSSRYEPGQQDVALDVVLEPYATPPTGLVLAGGRPARLEQSAVHVSGTFRLPGLAGGGGPEAPGALDLEVEASHADAFFFDYLFQSIVADVDGRFTGSGVVRGTFDRPVFEGRFDLSGGRLRVPQFHLAYEAEGSILVDRDGIHVDRVAVEDRTGGRAEITGSVLFNEYRYFSFDLHGVLDELQIMDVRQSLELAFYGQIWASGPVTLTGPISNATLRSTAATTSPRSNVFIPIVESAADSDAGFIVFADSTGRLPDLERLSRRTNLLARRPVGEREFLDGLEMDLNIVAREGTTVHLVIDPLLGDVINAVGSGRIQLQRTEGEFYTFGSLEVSSGDYLFTAGELFFRRFLIDSGRITWDGDPLNASLDIEASYRTRASTAGLETITGGTGGQLLLPLIVQMHVTGRVASPLVDLRLAIDQRDPDLRNQGYEAELNQPDRAAEYATSVLLTNSFLLTTERGRTLDLTDTGNQLAFNSLSQLVASQLNRYINQALPNVDLNFGVQGESTQDLDVTYGVALRLLDERLIIRGQGFYANGETQRAQQGFLDQFVVEVRLNPRISVEVFYRRDRDLFSEDPVGSTSTTGAGLSYETQFTTWPGFFQQIFGWLLPGRAPEERRPEEAPPEAPPEQVVADAEEE